MKIIYIKNDGGSFFEELKNEIQIGGINLLFVDGKRRIDDASKADRKDSEHFISYNHDDYLFYTRGLSYRDDYEDYLRLETKILDRIEENETIILLTDIEWGSDDIDFMTYLMQKKAFNLHIIKKIYPYYTSNDYHEYLRVFNNLNKIKSIVYIGGNFYPTNLNDSNEAWEKRKKIYYQFMLDRICEIVQAIQRLDKNKFYIYNHQQKQYVETQRPDYSGDSMFEFVTPSNNKNLCELLCSYRKKFAEINDLDYDSKSCVECECKDACKSVCNDCDWTSRILWENKYTNPYNELDEDYPYEYDYNVKANLNGIDRLRIDTDGTGIRSLILMSGCPLDCKYCGNRKYKDIFPETKRVDIEYIEHTLEKDGVYFDMTNGGVTFGGGEPLLQADFIREFHKKYPMWDIVIETCLNVDFSEIEKIASYVGYWYIDIKDMNPEIYRKYTGKTNEKVISNLKKLISIVPDEKVCIRIPNIPNYNNENDIEKSISEIKNLGYNTFELFNYKLFKNE